MRRLIARAGTSAIACLAAACCAATADAASVHPTIVNGTRTSITAVPWQVFIYNADDEYGCGGSVLSAKVVLTAAHCLAKGTQARPPSHITVLAGASDIASWFPGEPTPDGAQVVKAAKIRMHPNYAPAPVLADDIAVVTLAESLDLSTSRTKPIALAPPGGAPPPGAPLLASGYGAQSASGEPDGKLYKGPLAVVSDVDCLTTIGTNVTATVLCANGPTGSATCFGDSGGPLVSGTTLVGVVSGTSDGAPCTGSTPGVYVDVTVPEVRAFIDGSDSPPLAPRLSDQVAMTGVNPPVVGSPVQCIPGAWTGAASVAYTFIDDASRAPFQAGAASAFTPQAAQLGASIGCVVEVAGPGGVSTARAAGIPPLLADGVAPRALLRSVRCRKRTCRVRLQAVDANSDGALRVRVTAERRVRGWCPKGKGHKRHRVRCSKRRAKRFAVRHVGGVSWVGKARHVKHGRATVRLRVADAAGNRATGRGLKRRVRVR